MSECLRGQFPDSDRCLQHESPGLACETFFVDVVYHIPPADVVGWPKILHVEKAWVQALPRLVRNYGGWRLSGPEMGGWVVEGRMYSVLGISGKERL